MDIYELRKAAGNAVAGASPDRGTSRYRRVYVLLLRWENDQTGISQRIQELQRVFQDRYHYRTEEWAIPQQNSSIRLGKKLKDLPEKLYEEDVPNESDIIEGKGIKNEEVLRIVYYGGYCGGQLNSIHLPQWSWYVKSLVMHNELKLAISVSDDNKDSPKFDWASFQRELTHADPDFLVLLDCYNFEKTGLTDGKNITEIIAAITEDALASSDPKYSFTSTLIEELEDLSFGPGFSASMLHERIILKMINKAAAESKLCMPKAPHIQINPSEMPTHASLANSQYPKSIVLGNLSEDSPILPSNFELLVLSDGSDVIGSNPTSILRESHFVTKRSSG